MGYNVLIDSMSGGKAGKTSTSQTITDKERNEKGLTFLKKGQQITGVVVSVEEQVTLDFSGQKVSAPRELFNDVAPGETKTFEVLKVTDKVVELRVLEETNNNLRKVIRAIISGEPDREVINNQKGRTAKLSEKEAEFKTVKSQLEEIVAKLTEQDCSVIEEEGFAIETFTIKGLYEALNRVKEDDRAGNQKPESKKGTFDKKSLAKRLQSENLPASEENVHKLSEALQLVKTIAGMDDKAMKYLISNGVEPSVENIYKAFYSANTKNQEQPEKLTDKVWDELEEQVKQVITDAGYEVNKENLEEAKWLIENQLPLTDETFSYKKDLKEIKSKLDINMALDRMIVGMRKGISPKDASLRIPEGISGEQIISDIHEIREDTIAQAVKEDIKLTIKNMLKLQETLPASKTDPDHIKTSEKLYSEEDIENSDITEFETNDMDEAEVEYRFKVIKARRQMEEIRLKMTVEAAGKLEKKGFSIETERLERVVEELKKLEESYYKNLLKEADAEASELSIQNLKETTQSIEALKHIPCYVLGSTLSLRNTETIPDLLTEGKKLSLELAKAGTAYETLMTMPSSEYGDSIKKAFANMDSLLNELKLESTEQNQRAIRILGYNQMEINQESIEKVKAYDLQVTTMIKNLHPGVTVRMLRDGINPLEMPINELNYTIDRIKEEQGITSEDKFSTYLRNLEKADGITAPERKAYIGIYRLLYNVEKSDGAALGSVIKAGREVTLEHLLTALQTDKKGRLEAVINDDFGTLQSISHSRETISEQLSGLGSKAGSKGTLKQLNEAAADVTDQSFSQEEVPAAGQGYAEHLAMAEETITEDEAIGEKQEYLNRILKLIKDEITPEKLQDAYNLVKSGTAQGKPSIAAPMPSVDQGIWDAIKDQPIEKLLEQLQNMKGTQAQKSEVYEKKLQEIRELCKNSEQAVRFLNDFEVPSTPVNIMMANHLLSNGESPIKKLLKIKNENTVENSENGLKELNELSDKLDDKHSMEEEYNKLNLDAKAMLTEAYSTETLDRQRLAELKSIGQQITFLRTLAQREFYQIPIETERGITNMNLTILRGTGSSGKVSVTVHSEQLGNIKVDFTLKDKVLKGFISGDNRRGLEKLKENVSEIEGAAKENDLTLKQMDFGIQQRENDTYSYQNQLYKAEESSTGNDTERKLYRLAKAVVRTIRLAENSGSDLDLAVS